MTAMSFVRESVSGPALSGVLSRRPVPPRQYSPFAMYNHAPADYRCPLCALTQGTPDGLNVLDDIILHDEQVLAFVAPAWWPNNPGHVLVIPTDHYENLYDLPVALAGPLHAAIRAVALALKATSGCDGVATRQHNEPAGN